jgi:hypothetical protein
MPGNESGNGLGNVDVFCARVWGAAPPHGVSVLPQVRRRALETSAPGSYGARGIRVRFVRGAGDPCPVCTGRGETVSGLYGAGVIRVRFAWVGGWGWGEERNLAPWWTATPAAPAHKGTKMRLHEGAKTGV